MVLNSLGLHADDQVEQLLPLNDLSDQFRSSAREIGNLCWLTRREPGPFRKGIAAASTSCSVATAIPHWFGTAKAVVASKGCDGACIHAVGSLAGAGG